MSENKCGCNTGNAANALNASNGTVCIDTYRVMDSCRDRDCYEDVRIFVTEAGQTVLNTSCNVRVKSTQVLWANIALSEVAFNDGFYQVTIKYYIKLNFEACGGTTTPKCFEGLAILQKNVILFGGEGSASVFRSDGDNSFCSTPDCTVCPASNLPTAIVETIAPVALSSKVVNCDCECGYCCCGCSELPESLNCFFESPLVDPETGNNLYISLGIFSVIRIVRPAQILVNGTDYTVPDKECVEAEQDDPCSLFRCLAFPVSQFTGINTTDTANSGGNSTPARRSCCNGRS